MRRGACELDPPRASRPDPDRMRRALEYLADESSWLGDPHHHFAVLFGPDTPCELAREALGMAAASG